MNHKAVIMLVEDNEMDVVLTLDAFKEARLINPIQVARTGEDALEYLGGIGNYQNRTLYPLPELILLDLKLPGVSGLDLLKADQNQSGSEKDPRDHIDLIRGRRGQVPGV